MDSADIRQLIVNLAGKLLPKGARLILFGSRARQTAREDSDWDLLILLEKNRRSIEDLDRYVYPFRELGWSLNVEINPIISTFKDMETRRHSILLYQNIENDGIILWG